jgi:hypothetical protein
VVPALLGAVVLVAPACGGGGSERVALRELSARGARFSVPSGWHVTRTPTTVAASAGEGSDELVSVSVFKLLRAFQPSLWARVVPELDRAADQLARQLRAQVALSETITIPAGRARAYELTFRRDGRAMRERITFVLRDRQEYELLCRWPADQAEPEACATLVSSFRPA